MFYRAITNQSRFKTDNGFKKSSTGYDEYEILSIEYCDIYIEDKALMNEIKQFKEEYENMQKPEEDMNTCEEFKQCDEAVEEFLKEI